jgi:flagellar basal-body rod modification protein FlgD
MTTVTSTTQASTTTTNSARTSLADNFETFLTLLTAQLKNQDPLSPMDSNEFTNQLVQFSGVEQQLKTNDLLESLTENSKLSSASTAVAFLGKEATATTNLAGLVGGQTASWTVELPQNAQTSTIKISDENGRVVRTETGPTARGASVFTWDGKDAAGRPSPSGTYSIEFTAADAEGRPISGSVYQRGIITGVDMSGNSPTVVLAGASIPMTAITNVGLQSTQ